LTDLIAMTLNGFFVAHHKGTHRFHHHGAATAVSERHAAPARVPARAMESGRNCLSLAQYKRRFAQIPRQFADNAGYSNRSGISDSKL
jgi:hypothetical protein